MDQLIEDLKFDEGLRLKPYRCTAGKLTIGYGRNLDNVGISEGEAEHLLENDVARLRYFLDKRFPWSRTLPEAPKRALENMTFQLGFSGISGFKKMLYHLQRGSWSEAADEALNSRWAKQTPSRAKRVTDLMRRG